MSQIFHTRKRAIPGPRLLASGTHRALKTEPWGPARKYSIKYEGEQITASEGHPWKGSSRSGDIGGPFWTSKSTISLPSAHFSAEDSGGFNRIEGNLCDPMCSVVLQNEDVTVKVPIPKAFEDIPNDNGKGATAVSLCSPTNPVADVSTFLAEAIAEGRVASLPGSQTWKDRTRTILSRAAGEFLNVEFGWLPLKTEVHNFGLAVRNARTVLKQYKRDEGKLVRRRFYFPVESHSSQTLVNSAEVPHVGAYGSVGGYGNYSKGDTTLHTKEETRIWFAGAFRYYIPDQNDSWSQFMEHGNLADKLFGITLTPEVLWELAPWSWAVDYFSNAQQVLQNLQNMELYGLIMQYGYLMTERVKTETYRWESRHEQGKISLPVPERTIEFRSKAREHANPYGFGILDRDLSPLQVAILAAAGITRFL